MKLNFNSFCSQLIFYPCKAETKRDRLIATVASLVCALLFAGLCHLACACRQFYIKKKNQKCPSDQKIVEVAKPILMPKKEIKPSFPIDAIELLPREKTEPSISNTSDDEVGLTTGETRASSPTIPDDVVGLLPKEEVKPSNSITSDDIVELQPKEEVKPSNLTIPDDVVGLSTSIPTTPKDVAIKKANSEFVTIKSQCVTEQTAEYAMRGQQVPLLQIDVCSQRQFPNGDSKCGYHALKNGFVGLGIAKGIFHPEDLISAKTYHDFMAVLNTILPEDRDLMEMDVRKVLKELSNTTQNPQSLPMRKPLQKLMQEYQNNITVTTYYEVNNPFEGEMGYAIPCRDNAQTIVSFIELDKKLSSNHPFHHLFLLAPPINDWAHWIVLILEKDENGNLCWYGMDSWDNQKHVLKDTVSTFSQLLEKMTILEERRSFIKKWYRNIIKLPSDKVFSKKWKEQIIGNREILKDIKAAINFMKYDHWFDDYDFYADEINELKTVITFLNDKNYANKDELLKMLNMPTAAA